MNTQLIKIMDCVGGTSTNKEGEKLFNCLSPLLNRNTNIKLSLEGCTPMSSSFLNSSFGELAGVYGLQKVKELIRLVSFTPSQAEGIRNYLNMIERLPNKAA